MTILVFDIETIPDVTAGRRLYNLEAESDAEIAQMMFARRAEETGGSDFLKLHLHRVVAISVVLRHHDTFKVWSLGDLNDPEAELLQRFFDGIERYTPTLVSWNGTQFDLPVLHYRSLLNKIVAPRYWEKDEPAFKWNNYLSRYHERHTDLMDVLANYSARANVPLDEIATLLGFPGKMGMHGSKVWENYLQGDLISIRNYCETDVLNTYLVYSRFLVFQGKITPEQYELEYDLVIKSLLESDKDHLIEFAKLCEVNRGKN